MKKIFIAFLLLLTLAGTQSCKKNLEEVPYSSLSSTNVFTTEQGLKLATMGIYLTWVNTGWQGSSFAHGIFDPIRRFVLSEVGQQYATGGTSGTLLMEPYMSFSHSANLRSFPVDAIGVVWQRLYFTISSANNVIDNANKAVSGAAADVYIAEAKLNRAYAYFDLARNFGGVPLVKKSITSLGQKDEIFGARSSLEDTYNFIIEDLQFAEQKLPNAWLGADKEAGRATAGAAKALLGKVYLQMAGKPLNKITMYDKAMQKLMEVVNGPYGYGLEADFASVFSTKNKKNKEVILAFTYKLTSASPDANLSPFFLQQEGINTQSVYPLQTEFGLTYSYYQLFENGDKRRDFTARARFVYKQNDGAGGLFGDSIVYDPVRWLYINKRLNAPNPKWGNGSAYVYGLGYGKFSGDDLTPGAIPWGYNDDLIELRYADVLLMLAEALNESGKSSDAVTYLNMVRSRAGATPYSVTNQDDLRQKIRKERKLELMGEGTTVYDIRRWGTLKDEMAAMSPMQVQSHVIPAYNPKFELYPIPQQEIDLNPALTQNPGW